MRECLAGGPWPARNPDQNVADLKAQLAANARGVAELEALIARTGRDTVTRYMAHVQDNAEACVREVIGRLADGHRRYEMDDGSAIEVAVAVDREAVAPTSTSRAPRRSAGQFQRAVRGLHGGRALCVPHAGRRRYPAERGLPAAALDPRPRARC